MNVFLVKKWTLSSWYFEANYHAYAKLLESYWKILLIGSLEKYPGFEMCIARVSHFKAGGKQSKKTDEELVALAVSWWLFFVFTFLDN